MKTLESLKGKEVKNAATVVGGNDSGSYKGKIFAVQLGINNTKK